MVPHECTLNQLRFVPGLRCSGNCAWHVSGPFGSQGQAPAARGRSEPCHRGRALTWHGPRARTVRQPWDRLCSPSCNETPNWREKQKRVGCRRVPGAYDGTARAETTTPPRPLRRSPLREAGQTDGPPFPPLFSPLFFFPPRGHLQRGRSVPPGPETWGRGGASRLAP